ncbi:o-succinylbenzoate synthase [Solibacillus sp. R5-41]|uniref:o-succinylbenzoate synthase n=1 Tax=Solibacillus sp. R5-41 TaxID=2048654 RepID=UPI000C128BC8|nr:o-succinylbenzoate synthase [Solibacillus sp. R5-41]ATP39839.1 o-succinylbenzoate synthase [Solibacillus sp. R5-41]
MKITEITIRHLQMKLKAPFTTSFGTFTNKDFLVLEAKDESGTIGWGESVAFHSPWYNEETLKTNWHMLEDYLIPLILKKEINHPDEVSEIFEPIRKNNMAKSTIEGAIWDIYAQQTNQSLAATLGGKKDKIEVGISIGIQKSIDDLVALVDEYVNEGYKRIKVKIKPGWDIEVMRTLREKFPDVAIMADANSAYRLADMELLKQLDEFNLTMVEQPLASDDIIDHATLQKQMTTPICLDESIHSLEDARKAIEIGATKIINIKIGRVGGLTEAKKIHDYCEAQGIPVWCGGMLESGIGRAHNVALTTLENFILPGDTASSNRYWEKDIIEPEVVAENGYITVLQQAGIGYKVDVETIESYTVEKKTYQ